MKQWSDVFAPLLGRILVGGYFLWSGIEAALNFPNTVGVIAASGILAPVNIAIIFVAIEVLGGIALVVGYKTSAMALALAIFTIASAFLYSDFNNALEQALFLKDMAIVGGLLYISAFGSGSWAADWHY